MRLRSDTRDQNIPADDMLAYLQARIEALSVRNQELEAELATACQQRRQMHAFCTHCGIRLCEYCRGIEAHDCTCEHKAGCPQRWPE